MNEATHRLDLLRDAVDDLLVIQSLYTAATALWEFANSNPQVYQHRNFEIFAAELVKRGKILKELREDAILMWLEGRPIDLSKYGL